MKKLTVLVCLVATSCFGQLTRVPVITDTNGVLIAVTNLFTANSNSLNKAVSTNAFFWVTNAAGGISNAVAGPVQVTGNGKVTGTLQVSGYSGTVGSLTNGAWTSPALTNATNYGLSFSSPGSGAGSEQFGQNATASGANSVAVANTSTAEDAGATAIGAFSHARGYLSTAVGDGAVVTASSTNGTSVGNGSSVQAVNGTAIGVQSTVVHSNSTAVGYHATSSAINQVMLGDSGQGIDVYVSRDIAVGGSAQITGNLTNAHFAGTNTFGLGSDISFARRTITTIANGNNSGTVLTTNTFFELSGASAAFTNCGFAGGYDGKFVMLVYQGGQTWYIGNENGNEATAGNRIRTGTGADVQIGGNPGWAMMVYSASASRWLLFTPANSSSTLASSVGNFVTANIGTLTLTNQIASTNISHTFLRTNFVSGQLYTNAYGGPINVSANATLTTAAGVSGASVMALECLGNVTNYSAAGTGGTTLADTYTNILSAVITNNGTYTFTNRSTGGGNSAGVAGGQIIVY